MDETSNGRMRGSRPVLRDIEDGACVIFRITCLYGKVKMFGATWAALFYCSPGPKLTKVRPRLCIPVEIDSDQDHSDCDASKVYCVQGHDNSGRSLSSESYLLLSDSCG
jgi:hypothetical protein